MKINTLFEQFIESKQFVRIATFFLLVDLSISLLNLDSAATSPFIDRVAATSLHDLIVVFFILLLIRVYWTPVIFIPYVILRIYSEIDSRFIDKDSDYEGLWTYFFNVWVFTRKNEDQNYGYVTVMYYCTVVYYCAVYFFSDRLAIHSVAKLGAQIVNSITGKQGYSDVQVEIIGITILVFLFFSAFFGALTVFYNLKATNTEGETQSLRESNDRAQRRRIVDAQEGMQHFILNLSENQRRLFLIELMRLRARRGMKK